jgi:hypothetical protein
MTIFATTCLSFAAIRCIEEFARFCLNFISRLRWFKNKEKVIAHEWKTISARVSPDLHAMIKAHALLMDLTITDYILIAINEKLKRENHG